MMIHAVHGAVRTKSIRPIEVLTLSPYPVYFYVKSVKEGIHALALSYKVLLSCYLFLSTHFSIQVDAADPILNDIRAALDTGAEILLRYLKTSRQHLLEVWSTAIPPLLDIVYSY